MKIIGITGGVGSGKSTVLDLLEKRLGAYIIKADNVANMLMTKGHKAYDDIVEVFGESILCGDATIDKNKMAQLIFNDKNKRLVVNSIVHPQVKKWITEKIAELSIDGRTEYVFVEAALLIEDHYDAVCDEIWYIYADEASRRERLKTSRGYSDEKITSIYESQMPEEAFRKASTYTIDNSGDIENTYAQIKIVMNLH